MIRRKINESTKLPVLGNELVYWKYRNTTHFVVMCNDKVVFDPAGNSNTVKNGQIDSIREFI